MPKVGYAQNMWAPQATEPDNALPTYGTGRSLGGAVSAAHTPNIAETKHYSDNRLKNTITKFADGDLPVDVDDIDLETQALVYGATYADDMLSHGGTDTPPFGGLSFYETILTEDNVLIFRGYFYPKVKGKRGTEDFKTQQENIELGLTQVAFKVMQPKYGKYEYIKDFSSEVAADAWVKSNINYGTFYTVSVAKSGVGAVSPIGSYEVASGEDFAIAVPAGIDTLHDNGTDVLSSIVAGVYTIADIAADHEVVAVYLAG